MNIYIPEKQFCNCESDCETLSEAFQILRDEPNGWIEWECVQCGMRKEIQTADFIKNYKKMTAPCRLLWRKA